MSRHLRFFSDIAWENLALQEAEDRRREAAHAASQVTPQLAQRTADLSFAYPDANAGIIGGMATMGIDALSPEADAIAARNAQLNAAGFETPDPTPGIWDAGVGRAIKGLVRGTFTVFQSLYDEIVKGGTSYIVGVTHGMDKWGMQPGDAAYGSFGLSPGAVAGAQLVAGEEVDLGTGFFPGGTTAERAHQAWQRRGIKLPGTETDEPLMFGLGRRTSSEGRNLAVTPGRVLAHTISEPGNRAYDMFSGLLDFGANIFVDPADKLGKGIAALRRSNHFLQGALVDGRRPTMLGRTVDDWLASSHGDQVAQSFADETDYLTLHSTFRKNAARSNVDARFIRTLADTTDKNEVKNLLSTLGNGGAGKAGQLKELPVGQTIGGRIAGARSMPSAIAGALVKGVGGDPTNIRVNGLRSVMKPKRAGRVLDELTAEVGMTALRVEDISGSVDDFGSWLQASGFSQERVSHWMGEMARLNPEMDEAGLDVAARMYGLVKGAMREFGDELVKDGIPKEISTAFTTMFNSVSDMRKYWIDQLGNPQYFPGTQYTVYTNGQLQALPRAQLFAEFMDHAVPLPDIRRMRKALRHKRWAATGTNFRIEKMEGWDDLGPGAMSKLMTTLMQDVWKPMVLLRIAWPVRVISEEQVRMLAAGLDSAINHPLHGFLLAIGKGDSYLGNDVLERSFDDDVAALVAAKSRKGMDLGREGGRAMYTGDFRSAAVGTPDYWKGLAVEYQQLADDPIAALIARRLIDATDEAEAAGTAIDVKTILREIKDGFSNPTHELSKFRDALAVDGNRWKLINSREAADGYIDSVYGRIVHKAGGDVVYADMWKGEWRDMYGNKLEFVGDGQYRNPQTGEVFELPDPPKRTMRNAEDRRMMLSGLSDIEEVRVAKIEEAFESLLGYDVDNLQHWDDQMWRMLRADIGNLNRTMNDLQARSPEEFADILDDMRSADNPMDFWNWITDNFERAMQGDVPSREILMEKIESQLDVLDNFVLNSQSAAPESGRATLRALDMMEMSGDPEMIRTRFAGMVNQPGMPSIEDLANKQGWTPDEIAQAITGSNPSQGLGRITVRPVPEGISKDGKVMWIEPVDSRTSTVWIAHNGMTTGYMTVELDDAGQLLDVPMFSVADQAGRTITTMEGPQKALPGATHDASDLINKVMDEFGGGTTQDIHNIMIGGTTVRDWLESAGKLPPMPIHSPSAFADGFEGVIYHGSTSPLPDSLEPLKAGKGRAAGNLYGPGLYATNSYHVAATPGYGGDGGQISTLRWKGDAAPKVLDLEAEAPEDVRAIFQSFFDDNLDAPARPGATVDELYSQLRFNMMSFPADFDLVADDFFLELNQEIADLGYDMMRYDGGVRIGGAGRHDAYAILRPENLEYAETATRSASSLTNLEIMDFLRQQHDAMWSSRGDMGPLGKLPSIELSGQGAAYTARLAVRIGRGSDPNASALAWPAEHMFYQALKGPDTDALRIIADGRVGDTTVSFRGALDETDKVARTDLAGEKLREALEDRVDRLPKYTKVPELANQQKMDSAIDWMFDTLMSKPTNALSRVPAFKQFYWKRIAQLMPYMDDATKAAALKAAKTAGVGRGDLRSMVRAAFSTDDITTVKLDQMADDFVKGRFDTGTGTKDFNNLVDADEIAKAFALEETKRLLYDLSKKTNFFDMTRNIFPFGEAWYEIMTTWSRLIMENPNLLRRVQQGIQGARNTGFFYPDPSTDEEVFAMPWFDKLAQGLVGGPDQAEGEAHASPTFTGRVEGLNIVLGNFLPGVGPLVQIPVSAFAQDFVNKPEMRWARNLVFPFGYPDADSPSGLVDSVMPAWFKKALVGMARPSADDERLYNNTVIDVLRAMEINGEMSANASPAEKAALLELAKKRARRIYQVRAISQFVGPTGAQVRWDVDLDPTGEAFAFQVLATEYRKMIEGNRGDRVVAFQEFVDRFGFDPAAISTAKTEQIIPGTVTEYGIDFENENPELFRDYPLTAYYVAPDPADAQFNYNAYLDQLESGDRVPLSPEQWLTERNRLLGSIAYERIRRSLQGAQVNMNRPEVQGYLRMQRFYLMEEYPGFGYENFGVATQADRWQFIEEFDGWRNNRQLATTQAGRGLNEYLNQRDRVLALAASEYGVSERGFGNAKATTPLRTYLLMAGEDLARRYPDFGTIFQRHYLWEVQDPEPEAPTELLGVDFSNNAQLGGE